MYGAYFIFIADFAMVANAQKVPNTKMADIRQALRCKLNSLRFNKTKRALVMDM